MRHHIYWSPEEDNRLREMHKQGTPMRVIAERVGRTERAVKDRVCHIDHHSVIHYGYRRFYSEEEDSILREAVKNGYSIAAVAQRINRTDQSIRQRMIYMGIAEPKPYKARVRYFEPRPVEAEAKIIPAIPVPTVAFVRCLAGVKSEKFIMKGART
jgi:transposase-like protein